MALIFNPSVSETELLQAILMDFGLKVDSQVDRQSKKELVDELNRFLLEEQAKGRNSVLIIDEAQALSPQVLEEVRLLSNLETEKEKLLQIILMGQPELKEKLDLPNLRQLNQRISVRYTLQPLRKDEVILYVHHRLTTAGSLTPPVFTGAAIRTIYAYSQGIPRLINIACDRALLCGYIQETHRITSRIVRKGMESLEGVYRERGLTGFLRRHLFLSGSLVLLFFLLFTFFSTGWISPGTSSPPSSPQDLSRASSSPPSIPEQQKEVSLKPESLSPTPKQQKEAPLKPESPSPAPKQRKEVSLKPESLSPAPKQQKEVSLKPKPSLPVTKDDRQTSPSTLQTVASSPPPPTPKQEEKRPTQQKAQPVAAKSDCQGCLYTLQIASLRTQVQAFEEIQRIKKKLGSPVFFEKVEIKDKETWYRIYFGRFVNLDEAKFTKRKLKGRGWSTPIFVTQYDRRQEG